MLTGSDCKQDSPCCLDDETSIAKDDVGIHPRRHSHIKKIILHDKNKKVPFAYNKVPFEFMALPREIRNIIYHMTLTHPNGALYITFDDSNNLCRSQPVIRKVRKGIQSPSLFPDFDVPATPTRNLGFLRASKTVHAEAGAILYGQKLIFDDLVALQGFLARLGPSHLGLLRHVVCAPDDLYVYPLNRPWNPHGRSRTFMPSVFSLLAGADNLETLDPDIMYIDPASFGNDYGMLTVDEISVAGWDAVVARKMAAKVYPHLFTYLRRAVAVRGIDKVMDVLDVFCPIFLHGPDYWWTPSQLKHVTDVKWTEERKVAMKRAMGKEIERLLKQDNF